MTKTNVCPLYMSVKANLVSIAARQDWLPVSPFDLRYTVTLATKEFDTAVGPKTADLMVQPFSYPSKNGSFVLLSSYLSEGRNVLASETCLIDTHAHRETLVADTLAYIDTIEHKINDSYARRLYLRFTA